MLVEAARHYREIQEGDPSKLTFTGQEINPDIYAIAKINLFVHGLNGDIQRGDSLGDPKFEENGELDTFDYVLANFPFSADWPKDDLQDDPWNRFDWADKLPRADRGDYAFIMHMAEQLNDTGQAAIVVPHGVLFRKHESKYREPMIDNDLVEAVIGLPENLFQNNSIPSVILLLNRDKPAERENQVQFLHAADEAFYREESNQNILTPNGLDHIVENFKDWTTEKRVSRTVGVEEIRENDYNLNIALYVDTTEPEEEIDVVEELAELRRLQAERDDIEARVTQHMEALNYE
jgi:type I restriction enzyme M protein